MLTQVIFQRITPEAFRIVNSFCGDLIPRLGYELRHGSDAKNA